MSAMTDTTARETSAESGVVVLEIRDDHIAILRLGAANETMLTLTEARLQSLDRAIEVMHETRALRGVIITGPGPGMFAAGADISLIQGIEAVQTGIDAATYGRSLFGRLRDLSIPVVGAIEGPCLGGGLELALAFDVRIASDHHATLIGLPEVKLGIIPGFGGTQRLTRLIGLPKALDMILKGKMLTGKKALRLGVVDRVVPKERLLDTAIHEVERLHTTRRKGPRRKLRGMDAWIGRIPLLRNLVERKVSKTLSRGQARFYDAPRRALSLCLDAVRLPEVQGFANEARALGELIVTPTCKGLVHLYFLTERSKRLGKGTEAVAIERTRVIGGGVMGAGIAACLAVKGIRVRLCDLIEENLAAAKARLQKALQKRLKRRSIEPHEAQAAQDKLTVSADWGSLEHTDMLLEAVPERMDIKRNLFRDAQRLGLPDAAIIATNTSSLSIDAMAEGLPNPERVVGIHFFNPPEQMPLVEVVRGVRTSAAAVQTACRLAVRLGKYPVVVDDKPGFLVNRCLGPYLDEAARLMIEGNSPEFIDSVMLGFGMPMGPARLLDEIGFDVAQKVSEVLSNAYADRMQPCELVGAMVEAGHLGKKKAGGLYDKSGKKPGPGRAVLDALCRNVAAAREPATRTEVLHRLIYPMVDEAFRCLEEGVVSSPEDLDLGLVMGIGFPPFTGGIARYARGEGIEEIARQLAKLASEHGPRFAPADSLSTHA